MFTLEAHFGGSALRAEGYADDASKKRHCAAQHIVLGLRLQDGFEAPNTAKTANLDETTPLLTLFRSRFRADGDVFASRYSFGNDRWILESSPRIDCQTTAVAVEED